MKHHQWASEKDGRLYQERRTGLGIRGEQLHEHELGTQRFCWGASWTEAETSRNDMVSRQQTLWLYLLNISKI